MGMEVEDSTVGKTTSEINSYVSWVSQYPEIHAGKEKNRVLKKIGEILIGKKKQHNLVRPVSVIALNPKDFTVLDQGCQTILQVQGNDAELPHCLKKKENFFTSLVGVCALPGGELLFTDSRLSKIYSMSADKRKLRVLNDTLKLQQPTGIAYSAINNEIWVVETNAHRIAILNMQGELIRTIGERGEDTGKFNFPTSICIDKAGDAYVVDAMNFRVQIFNKNGAFITKFGESGDVCGFFARPKGIAVDAFGNIYIVDGLFHMVQIFDRSGNFLYKFGKQGRDKEDFWMPNGISIDEKNYIYVADTYNSRIQIFKLING